MRSIRVRLLLLLLLLVTAVLGGLSWYLYEQMRYLLQAREMATAELLRTQAVKRINEVKTSHEELLIRQAEQLGRMTYERVEPSPVVPVLRPFFAAHFMNHFSGSVINPNITGHIAAHVLPIVSMQDYRFMLALFAKRSIVIPESTLEEGEFFFISTPRAKLFSQNVPKDCFKPENEKVRSLPLYVPDVREETLQCGTRYSLVSMKMPIIFESFWSGSFVDGATMVGRAQPRFPAQRREAANPPRAMYSMTIQVARPTEKRDKIVAAIRDDMERELAAVQRESAQVQTDTLNRLILICLATISLCALAITWISRSSLAPLVNVADAVSELTPKDLRLKFEGAELDPNKLPEELAPIVQRLQESLESLEQAFSREKRATADISHELRTPIASLLTTMQVALRKPRTEEEYRATLKQCVETGTHMRTLVERLMQLSRLDAGVDLPKYESVDLVELAGTCVDMVRPLAEPRGITIEMEVEDSASALEEFSTDKAKLREILVNLIDNAVHYNQDNGQVTVRIAASPQAVHLEVSDTGVGMDEETCNHLFERFFRADASRQSSTINAGLGLAIVKGYVDLFGGNIQVKSKPGQGSTFIITLPRNISAPVKKQELEIAVS